MTRILNQALVNFIETKISDYAGRIRDLPQRADRSGLGELEFYIALRNVVSFPNNEAEDRYDQASLRDHGLVDAVNDILIELKLINRGEKFYNPQA